MAMTYSMLPNEVSATYVGDKYKADSEDMFYFLSLSSLQNIANLMGDGWTAESISSGDVVLHWREQDSTESFELKSGKSIPVLKNTTLYPNLAICFTTGLNWYQHPQAYYACVLNVATGEALSTHILCLTNVDIYNLDVYSFNSKVKAIGGSTERSQEFSAIIFTEKGIITCNTMNWSGSTNNDYRIILPDGTFSDTERSEHIVSARTFFEPVFGEAFPDEVFDGIYLESRASNFLHRTVTYNGITYTVFGNNGNDSANGKPEFVVSSEILG